MFLSCLLIDTGINPDRPRPGRTWLRNLYHVHQRLCMEFPSAPRISEDPGFLKPFKPEDFSKNQVHVEREADSGFLFCIDPQPGGRAVILVQSAVRPDWEYAFHNARHLLIAPAEVKPIDHSFTKGQRLRFRLVTNPTKKIGTISKSERQSCTKEELIEKKGRHERRVPVQNDELLGWLADWCIRPDEPSGFSIEKDSTVIQPGYAYVSKGGNGEGHRLRSVRYEGILEVTVPDRLRNTLMRGIGPGKAFGFGLLSVALCPAPPAGIS